MALHKSRSRLGQVRTGRRPASARRGLPQLESLEGRALLTLDFASAIGLGGAGSSLLVGQVVVDSAGDTFVDGGFTGTFNFDPGGGSAGLLQAGMLESGFVAKYSPSNALVWAKEFAPDPGVSGSQCATSSLAVDNTTGVVYAVGKFTGTVDFAPGSGSPQPATSNGKTDAFIVELTPGGDLVSGGLKTFGGSGSDTANIVKLSPDGTSVYVTGNYSATVDFDPNGTSTSLTSRLPMGAATYVMRLTTSLGFTYVQALEDLYCIPDDLSVDGSGDAFVVGYVPESNNESDAFIAEVDHNGAFVDLRDLGGTSSGGTNAAATGLAVDSTGDVFVSGYFTGTSVNFAATLGGGTSTLDSAGGSDAFLIKLNPAFVLVWARRFGSAGDDVSNDMAIDANSNLYITGSESGSSSFGGSGPGAPVLGNTTGEPSAFVLEADSSGNLITAVSATGTGVSQGATIAVNSAGEVSIDGYYTPVTTFNGTSLGNMGVSRFFVATLTESAIAVPPSMPKPPPGSMPTPPPTFLGEHRLFAGKGRKKKLTGFELDFSSALDAGSAANIGHYRVTQPGRTRRSTPKVIRVLSATPGAGDTAVTLVLGKYTATKALSLMATGLLGAGGTPAAMVVARL